MPLNNEIRIIGNLVKEPNIIERKTSGDSEGKFARLRIASNTKRGDKEETLFIDVKLFGNCFNDLEYHSITKGDKVLIYGRLAIEDYKDKEGIDRREPIIYANSLIKLAKKPSSNKSF